MGTRDIDPGKIRGLDRFLGIKRPLPKKWNDGSGTIRLMQMGLHLAQDRRCYEERRVIR